jgi:hypothetical protein
MTGMKRRHFLHSTLTLPAIAQALSAMSLPAQATVQLARPQWRADPFALGVASGEPRPDSVLLWTRLYPGPAVPGQSASERQQQAFFEAANEYSLVHIDKILRPKAIEKINWHKNQGHKVVIVSASIDCWLRPWCEKNGLELIATKLEIKDDIVTGKLLSKNCYGVEKVNRIKELYDLEIFEFNLPKVYFVDIEVSQKPEGGYSEPVDAECDVTSISVVYDDKIIHGNWKKFSL